MVKTGAAPAEVGTAEFFDRARARLRLTFRRGSPIRASFR